MVNDAYWSVDLPGLSESGAARLIEHAAEVGVAEGGAAVDPRSWLTLHMDRETVETLAEGLRAAGGSTGYGLLANCEEWLEAARE